MLYGKDSGSTELTLILVISFFCFLRHRTGKMQILCWMENATINQYFMTIHAFDLEFVYNCFKTY